MRLPRSDDNAAKLGNIARAVFHSDGTPSCSPKQTSSTTSYPLDIAMMVIALRVLMNELCLGVFVLTDTANSH